jgi:adenylate cyclase
VRCPICGAAAAGDARFCANCGTPLMDRIPPSPVDPSSQGDRATRVDRATQGDHADPASGQAEAPAGDRRIVTALFADLVDYVRMLAEHDPEVVRARVTGALATMATAIERLDGTREKFIGDAVFAVFGWPRAHDDDAVRAALAALAIRAGLQERGEGGEPLEVRIGIATGEVVAVAGSAPDGDLRLTGEAITTAARIQSMAPPGEILLDDATRQAARGRLATEPRGSVVLRGQSTAVELHALRGEAGLGSWIPYRAAAPGPLVGRNRELTTIQAALDRTIRTGRGGVIVIVGDAGMGKSRLLQAAEESARARDFAWTWTENVSYGRGEPYRWGRQFAQSIADEHATDSGSLVRRFLFREDVPPEVTRRYGGAIAAIARDAAFSGWEAEAADMPSDPADIAATLVEVAAGYIDRLLETTGPRVIAIDDVHWLDPSSAAMVDLVIERTKDHPLLVLAAARPEAVPAWASGPEVERLDLGGLAEPETARLATIVARAAVDADGARAIHERTGGNPLFVGETVRAFLTDGTLRLRDGRVALMGTGEARLPITLRAVLGARIDALPSRARSALGVASVIGITFRPTVVAELLEEPLDQSTFDRLVEAALIVPSEDGDWRFSHALIHDAAYAGLLASRRRALHSRVADRLEMHGSGTSGQVAAHRVAAGEMDRAVPLLREAAESALALGAAAEAAAFWRQAADLAADDDAAAAAADRARAAAADAAAAAADRARAAAAIDSLAAVREAAGLDPAPAGSGLSPA